MASLLRPFFWLLALTMSSPAWSGTANVELGTAGTPPGFDQLAAPRTALVDVYFGGRKTGEALVTTRPGFLEFHSAQDLLAAIPQLIAAPELRSTLTSELATNSASVCRESNRGNCGVLLPEVAAIIYDEDRFRVDLFVNPRFLRTIKSGSTGYLPVPSAPLSLTSSVGVAASGTVGGPSAYNLQNRTIVGFRNARVRMNSSVASGVGLVVDDLVGEVDTRDLRYSAGLFWAPGNEFTGQRRIIGAGVGTQFDTWANQQSLRGTPLIVFLAQPSRIEILIDGRLVSSRSYPAGNVDVDTSTLPNGSYSVVLRIYQPNGSVREERRFFVRNADAPPLGQPIFYAYAGMLANTRRDSPVSLSDTFYYQAGGAWRLSNNLALDVAALGTQHKGIAQAGGWLISGPIRLRMAGLVSTSGDVGALLSGTWAGKGPLTASFDVRRIWSSDGSPLIPLPTYVDTFGETPPSGVQLASGSYTQATASLGLRLGDGFVGLVGSYRKDRDFAADYTIGPSVNWPLLTRGPVQLVLDASAQRTRSTTAAFAGFRVLFTRGNMSVLGTVGESIQDEHDDGGRSVSRTVGNVTAQYSRQTADGTLVNVEGGVDRNIETSTVNAGTTVYSRLGNLRADLLQGVEGGRRTQYDVSYETGIALSSNTAAIGGRDLQQSALIVAVEGDSGASFDVLVDEAVRGQVKAGGRLSLFVPGYRTYKVRLVPADPAPMDYDSAARDVTLYPGNVQLLKWHAERLFTIFAQATTGGGAPIANAMVHSSKGIAETDSSGYFQIDMKHGDPINIDKSNGQACQVTLPAIRLNNDFAALGKVVCS